LGVEANEALRRLMKPIACADYPWPWTANHHVPYSSRWCAGAGYAS
jgi:hypothetical protein